MNNPQYKNLLKELRIIGVESVQFLTQILTENDKYATGNLIKSIDYDVIKNADDLLLKIMAADYFKYVDEGRKPGSKQPPIKPILSWVKTRNIRFKNMTDKQTAFIIARSIGKKGIKPLNAKQKLYNNILQKKIKVIGDAALKDVSNILDKIIFDLKK